MVTFKAVVLPHQRHEDGTFNVKIRLTHKRRSKYIPTTFTAYPGDLKKNLDIKPTSSLMFRCLQEIRKYSDAVTEMGYLPVDAMDVSQLADALMTRMKQKESFRLDFFKFGEELVSTESPGTGRNHTSALNSFARFLGRRECDINDITGDMVRKFAEWYSAEPKMQLIHGKMVKTKKKKVGENSTQRLISYLGSIHNAARDRYNDEDEGVIRIPRRPFTKVRFGMIVHRGQGSLSVEEMQAMIDARPRTVKQQIAVDLFVVSFALMGMNLADMLVLPYAGGDTLTYCRKKTRDHRSDRAEITVKIPACIRERLERLSDGKEFISPLITKGNPIYFTSNCAHNLGNYTEKTFGRRFTIYAARHTFASLARNECGADKETVDECLAHLTPGMKLADVYIKKDWSRLWKIQQSVIDLFNWE